MRSRARSAGGPPFQAAAVSRRALLAAAGGLCAAAGFGRHLARAAASAPVTLTVYADVLYQARSALTAAWTAAHPRVRVVLHPSYAGSPPRGTTYADAMQEAADVLQVEGDGAAMGGEGVWPDLSGLVKEHNFDLGALPAAAVAAFRGSNRLYGLPVRMVPFAMTVDTVALSALHAGPTGGGGVVWTWSDLRAAVERAAAAKGGPSRSIVSRTGWTDVRVWGALVSGLSGTLVASGALDLTAPATVAAAAEFQRLAAAAGWPAVTGEYGPGVSFVPTPWPPQLRHVAPALAGGRRGASGPPRGGPAFRRTDAERHPGAGRGTGGIRLRRIRPAVRRAPAVKPRKPLGPCPAQPAARAAGAILLDMIRGIMLWA